MKILAASCMLMLLCTTAQANLTPLQRQAPGDSPDTWAIYTGPAGAMLELRNGALAAQRIEPCQILRNTVGGEIQVTQLCR